MYETGSTGKLFSPFQPVLVTPCELMARDNRNRDELGRFARGGLASGNTAGQDKVRTQAGREMMLSEASSHATSIATSRLSDGDNSNVNEFCRSVADEVEAWLDSRHGAGLDGDSGVAFAADTADSVPTRYVARMNASWAALQAYEARRG